MFESILSSFSLVAISEIGDKTQLLAFSLAARHKSRWRVMAGIFVATILNHSLAAFSGDWVAAHLSPHVLAIILACTFIAFGFWTLKPDTLDDQKVSPRFGPFWTTVFLFFLAEMGDKTQLATVALSAKFHSVFFVTIGTTLGMLVTDGLAVFLGERIAKKVQMKWIRYCAAGLFFAFGISIIVTQLM